LDSSNDEVTFLISGMNSKCVKCQVIEALAINLSLQSLSLRTTIHMYESSKYPTRLSM